MSNEVHQGAAQDEDACRRRESAADGAGVDVDALASKRELESIRVELSKLRRQDRRTTRRFASRCSRSSARRGAKGDGGRGVKFVYSTACQTKVVGILPKTSGLSPVRALVHFAALT